MTAITPGRIHTATDTTEIVTMFRRIAALFAAAGRAVPFHRENSWGLAGSTNFIDRDRDRVALEIRALSTYREHN
ncbi:hypothetical protein VMT65_35250 [Nocardia sp. CDC153]|uniref:hypothetical protein n=1 Tax=unclassified Nocardia TaxID=2637762 RepID=UPI002DB83E83|nr:MULTISPECIES: hypothetical protein [unclassified Nocardia]MEC3920171.1 hypothetical protein [Nocardia sp. CDC160]MEC3958335.1 hypothetical protein [Nocardia sp. CDC153]